jgi:hypothetical protein
MDVCVVYSEDRDWVAVYVDGRRKAEGHKLSAEQVLEAVGVEHKVAGVKNRHGRFTDNLSETLNDKGPRR